MCRWIVLALCALLGACAQVGGLTPPPAALFDDAAFAPPERPVDPAAVFAISPAMRAYLAERVAPEVRAHGLPRGLIDALYTNRQLNLAYDAESTRNAAETFDARAGNCLSLAILTGALARELGLEVRYQAITLDDSWGREGNLLMSVGHVNVSVGRDVGMARSAAFSPDWWTVDFLPEPQRRNQRTVPIEEARVVAMYLNNKAAEALAGGHTSEAYAWVRAAITADPAYDDAYNTLGVVYQRHGLPLAAERALRHTLARAPEHPHALGNLIPVLRQLGRPDEADATSVRLAALRTRTPFAAFDRGRQAMAQGDYRLAKAQFERALGGSLGYHEFHFWLALAHLNLGETEPAITHLRQAEENSSTGRQRALYAAKLERLQGGAGAPAHSGVR